jgi:hypothetical protein
MGLHPWVRSIDFSIYIHMIEKSNERHCHISINVDITVIHRNSIRYRYCDDNDN